MKTAGWAATTAAAVVLVGGGAWAATTLPASDQGTVAVETAPSPAASAGPVESVSPSEDPSAGVEETPVPGPEVSEEPAAPEYSEAEAELIQVTRYGDLADLELTNAEILEAAQAVCDERDAGLSGENLTTTVRGATDAQNVQFRINAVGSVCVAQD